MMMLFNTVQIIKCKVVVSFNFGHSAGQDSARSLDYWPGLMDYGIYMQGLPLCTLVNSTLKYFSLVAGTCYWSV